MKSIERALLVILTAVAVFDHASSVRAGGDARAVAASEFTLVSDQGRTVGSFRITPDGLPELVLADGMGRGRIVLAVKSNDDSVIGLTDASGKVRVGMIGEPDGRHSLSLSDEAMTPRLTLSVESKGMPRLSVQSARKKELASLGVDESETPRLAITNESGDSRLEYGPTGALGVFGLYLLGKSPAQRVGLEIDDANVAHVFAQDAGGKARAELQASNDAIPAVMLRDRAGRKLPMK